MGAIGSALAWLSQVAIEILDRAGYLGLFLLMVAESMVLPVPSEAVMPFAGALIAKQPPAMGWAGAILASSAGSLVGSYLGYLMGRHGLLPLVRRYGRYVLVHERHITSAQDFFGRRGVVAVFLCRFIPGVRHVSSIPAGAARMPLGPFLAASLAGATVWNTFLLWLGWRVAGDAAAVAAVKRNLDIIGIGLLALLAAYITYEIVKARRAHAGP